MQDMVRNIINSAILFGNSAIRCFILNFHVIYCCQDVLAYSPVIASSKPTWLDIVDTGITKCSSVAQSNLCQRLMGFSSTGTEKRTYVFSWRALPLAFGDNPAHSVPTLPASSWFAHEWRPLYHCAAFPRSFSKRHGVAAPSLPYYWSALQPG